MDEIKNTWRQGKSIFVHIVQLEIFFSSIITKRFVRVTKRWRLLLLTLAIANGKMRMSKGKQKRTDDKPSFLYGMFYIYIVREFNRWALTPK